MNDGSPRKLNGSSRVHLDRKRAEGQKWSGSGLRHDLAVGLISGTAVALLSLGAQIYFDDQRSDRETRLENLRFVRERSSADPVPRPFQTMDLEGQNLAGLTLEAASFDEAAMNGVRFAKTNLKSAVFIRAKMRGVSLFEANLEGAEMTSVDLSNAFIYYSNLQGVTMSSADLSDVFIKGGDFRQSSLSFSRLDGAVLDDVDLSATNLTGVCYTADTKWPRGFTPPQVDVDACEKKWGGYK